MNDEFNLVETKTSSNPMKWFFFQPEKSFNKLKLIKMMCIGVFILSQLKLTLILWNYGVSHSIPFLFSTLHRLYHWKNPLARWLFALHSNRLSIFQCLTVEYASTVHCVLYLVFLNRNIFFRSDIIGRLWKCIEECLLNFCCNTTVT